MSGKSENIIVSKTFEFACEILDIEDLLNEKRKYVLSKHLPEADFQLVLMSEKHNGQLANLIFPINWESL